MDVVVNAMLHDALQGAVPSHLNFYQNLLASMQYPNTQPPVADLLRRFHGLDGQWLVASPVTWQATHNDVMLTAFGDMLDVSDELAKQQFQLFSDFMVEEEAETFYHDSNTWLIRPSNKPEISAKPMNYLLHQPFMQALGNLDSTMYWQRVITSCQMLFSRDDSPVNGIWIWGHGRLSASRNRSLIAGDEKMAKLAGLLSSNVQPYSPGKSLAKNALLLFDSMTEAQHHALINQKATWYWNNKTYQTKASNWFVRLIRRIKHENKTAQIRE